VQAEHSPLGLIARAARRGRRELRALADRRRRSALQTTPRPARPQETPDPTGGAVLVVVAHPDDEVIIAAGLLRRAGRAGVICVSDGAPRSPRYAESAGFASRFELSGVRRAESASALALLGRDIEPQINLGVIDQEITSELVALARYLAKAMRSGFTSVVTHAYEGGHPDHDAVAFAVHAAAALLRQAGEAPPPILEAPVYNRAGEARALQAFLPDPDAGPVVTLELTAEERDLKRRMLLSHATQQHVLGDFETARELFRLAPRYHFSASPHAGRLGFEELPWPVSGRAWLRTAWRAIRELALIEELA